jgi:glutathione synthetase
LTTGRYLAAGSYPDTVEAPAMNLPENSSTISFAAGLRIAYEAYKKSTTEHECCVLFLVQDSERNIFDQRHIEYELQSHAVPAFRLPFSKVLEHTRIDESSKRRLLYTPPHRPSKTYEVAVAYFRAGYGPEDYMNEAAWQARLVIERSNAIKCPSILTQMAGAKKVQQVLATPTPANATSVLSRFVEDKAEIKELEHTFTNIYPLDESPAGLEARAIATDPERCKGYVLKPQREGGGNNIYRSKIPQFLKNLPETHWKGYILMEIITPPPVRNVILRNGIVEKGGVICELGIYGTCLWNQDTKEELHNAEAGYLLRTKGDQSEEGGVAAGFGAMDSCLLV